MIDFLQRDVSCGDIFLRAILLIFAPPKKPLNWALGAVGGAAAQAP